MVTPHQPVDSFHAAVYVAVGSRLLPVTPDLYRIAVIGQRYFPANRCRRFLSASVIGAERPKDIMEPDYPGIEAEVFPVMAADALHVQLLPSITVFCIGRIGILFSQGSYVGFSLAISRIYTGARGIQVPSYAVYAGGFDSVHV